ncbi:DNA-binding MarR family transcriptional regulator [Breznakia blatticola]|uniref:DNA-binding MarR family transcriptional regulator n=1 Tax=Breznakia blatticola TaxID=1754012 RepID=A0A4R8A6T5_9FIRM|nr:MarR family transcriptional regulator [Breznakia blatticola]TDW25288.1 DNA-binding MarR family transcriptional regulator [Breznakia blatticola]
MKTVVVIEKIENQISAIQASIQRAMKSYYAETGLSKTHTLVLREVRTCQPITLNELSSNLSKVPANMSITVSELEDDGYLERERFVDDRRVTKIKLTSKGEEVVNLYDSYLEKNLKEMVEDEKTLKDILTKLNTVYEKVKKY